MTAYAVLPLNPDPATKTIRLPELRVLLDFALDPERVDR